MAARYPKSKQLPDHWRQRRGPPGQIDIYLRSVAKPYSLQGLCGKRKNSTICNI